MDSNPQAQTSTQVQPPSQENETPVLGTTAPDVSQVKFANRSDKMDFILMNSEQQIITELKKAEEAYVKVQQQMAQVTNQRVALRAQLSVVQQLKARLSEPLNSNG